MFLECCCSVEAECDTEVISEHEVICPVGPELCSPEGCPGGLIGSLVDHVGVDPAGMTDCTDADEYGWVSATDHKYKSCSPEEHVSSGCDEVDRDVGPVSFGCA